MNKNQKLSITFILLATLALQLAKFSIFYGLSEYLMNAFGIEFFDASYYNRFLLFSLAFTSIFSGWLGDFVNRTRLILIGILVFILMCFVLLIIPGSLNTVVATLIIMGIGGGLVITNTIVLLGNSYNTTKNGLNSLNGFVLYALCALVASYFAENIINFAKNHIGLSTFISIAILFGIGAMIFIHFFSLNYKKINNDNKEIEITKSNKTINKRILVLAFIIIGISSLALNQFSITYLHLNKYSLWRISAFFSDYSEAIDMIMGGIFFLFIILLRKKTWKTILNILIIILAIGSVSYMILAVSAPIKIITILSPILLIFARISINPIIDFMVFKNAPQKLKGLFMGLIVAGYSITHYFLFYGELLYDINNSLAFGVFAFILVVGIVITMIFKRQIRGGGSKYY